MNKNLQNKINSFFLKIQFNDDHAAILYERIGAYLKIGQSLTKTLKMIQEQESDEGKNNNKPTVEAVKIWRKKIENGETFSQAIEGWVSEQEQSLIDAGERSSQLTEILFKVIEIKEEQKAMKAIVRKALLMPFVYIAALVGLFLMVGYELIPQFSDNPNYPPEKWTGIPAQLYAVSQFVQNDLIQTIVVFFSIIGAIIYGLPRFTGPVRAKIDLFAPFSIYRLYYGVNFMISLSSLMNANVAQTDALLRMASQTKNPWYKERIMKTYKRIVEGDNLGVALSNTKTNFPDPQMIIEMKAFADMKDFPAVLTKLSNRAMKETIKKITKISNSTNLILQGLIAGGAFFIFYGINEIINQMPTQ